jgi:hypothetical protein
MKKTVFPIFILLGIIGCTTNPPFDLSGQLRNDLSSRLLKVDSSARIDSFKISGVDTIVPRLGKIIDDTIYIRELHTVEEQLAHALTRPREDSIRYFQDEVNYMKGQIDTLTASIKTADTTNKYGIVVRCDYQISKHGKNEKNSIYYFLRDGGYIINSEMLDSFITRSYRALQ